MPLQKGLKWQSKEGKRPLEFRVGKHTVRFALRLSSADEGQFVSVVSNPVEITIGRVLPGSGLSIDEAIKEKTAFAAVCEAVEENAPIRWITPPGVSPTLQVFKVVEVLFGKVEAVDRIKLNYKYIYKEPECERAIRKHERVIWIGHTWNMSFHGYLYGLKALPDTPENRQAVKAAASQAATAWGEAVNGLRAAVEFVPEKESYSLGERVGVRFHIQNVSDHNIQITSTSWRQEQGVFVQDDEGKEISVTRRGGFSGLPRIVRYMLKPHETVVLKSSGLGFGDAAKEQDINTKPLTSNFIRCGPGRYFVYYKLTLPDITSRNIGDWEGVLDTGKRKLVLTSTVESDQKSTMQVEGALQKFIRQYSKQKIVCLDIGEQYTFRSHNGIEKLIRLASVKDYRDTVVRMVRRAEVVVVESTAGRYLPAHCLHRTGFNENIAASPTASAN